MPMIPTTRDFAVKFGRDPSLGLEGQKAFPFIYSFINHNDDTWTPVAPPVIPSVSCIGPIVPANSKITHNVLLDPDYNFKFLNIKYTCYRRVTGAFNGYVWYKTSSADNYGMDPGMNYEGTTLYRYIGITLSVQGSGNSTILHGGPDTGPIYAGKRIPLPLEAVQGYDYGFLAVRTPYLLPRQAVMSFEITNTSTYDLTVGAAIYGMKIRI